MVGARTEPLPSPFEPMSTLPPSTPPTTCAHTDGESVHLQVDASGAGMGVERRARQV